MNLNQIKAPFPKRAPKLVTPKSAAPWDVAAAITAIEHDAYEALVKEPAEAAGITPLPELPGPGTLISMVVSPLQNLFGGLKKAGQGVGGEKKTSGGSAPAAEEVKKTTAEDKLIEPHFMH